MRLFKASATIALRLGLAGCSSNDSTAPSRADASAGGQQYAVGGRFDSRRLESRDTDDGLRHQLSRSGRRSSWSPTRRSSTHNLTVGRHPSRGSSAAP
jgi:hypothetical protein